MISFTTYNAEAVREQSLCEAYQPGRIVSRVDGSAPIAETIVRLYPHESLTDTDLYYLTSEEIDDIDYDLSDDEIAAALADLDNIWMRR